MPQDVEQRIPRGQILSHHLGTIDVQGLALAQHQQPCGVVDLTINQHNANNGGIANGASGLHGWKRLELRSNVGRGITQHPAQPVAADGYGRLCAWRL